MAELMLIDGRKMSGHSKEHLKRPRQWNYNSVRLNERMKAVTANRGNKPTDSRVWCDETNRSAAGVRSIHWLMMQGHCTERFKRHRHWNCVMTSRERKPLNTRIWNSPRWNGQRKHPRDFFLFKAHKWKRL